MSSEILHATECFTVKNDKHHAMHDNGEVSMNETQAIVSQISGPFVTTLRNHVCLSNTR